MKLKAISSKNRPAMASIVLPTLSTELIFQIIIIILQILLGGGSILSFL